MADRFIESHIRRIPMFQRLPDAQLQILVQQFQVLRFQTGDRVIQQGNQTQGLFMMVNGTARWLQRRSDGQEYILAEIGDSDVLDKGALFEVGIESASLDVTSPSILLFLSYQRMQSLLSYYPELRNQLGASDVGTHAAPQAPIRPHARDAQGKALNIQRDNEEIILTRRRHPWSFVRRGWLAVLVLVFSATIATVLFSFAPALGSITLSGGLILSALLMTYYFFEWRNDSIIVTDQRVIKIERVIPTFSVTINEIPLDSIQEVNTSLPDRDLFARIFDYGDVELRNAGDAGDLVLDMVPSPEEIQDAIFAKRQRRQELADQNRRNVIRADIEKQLGLDAPAEQNTNTNNAPAPRANQSQRSFAPAATQFTNDKGETVIRKHVTVWLAAIMAPSFVIFSAFVILGVTTFASNSLVWLSWLGYPIAGIMLIGGVLWFWWSDWDWRNDLYIIGDDKITIIHKRPLWLQNEVEQILLERVDNVISETNGLFDTMFKRGNVRLSLIGEGMESAKRFSKVHRPHEVQAEISRRQARAKANNAHNMDQRQRAAISEYLSVYHETMQDPYEPAPSAPVNIPPSPRPVSLSPAVDLPPSPYSNHQPQQPPSPAPNPYTGDRPPNVPRRRISSSDDQPPLPPSRPPSFPH